MNSKILAKIYVLFFSLMAVFLPYDNSISIYALENQKSVNYSQRLKKAAINTGYGILSITAVAALGYSYRNSDNFFQRCVIGSDSNFFKVTLPENIYFTNFNIDNELYGYEYKAKVVIGNASLSGKYVIFYSGSGLSNAIQINNILDFYISRGATVIGVDYNGFGMGDDQISRGKIRQASIYSDAEKIYNYVVKHYQVKSSDILLHGYSLGGPVAAHVAASVSGKENKLCGLILQSSMKNTAHAAYEISKSVCNSSLVRILGSVRGYLFADSFDCEKELKRLYKKDPDIKISVCSGGENDHLSLMKTNLDTFLKNYGFKNITSYTGSSPHMTWSCSAPKSNFVLPHNLI